MPRLIQPSLLDISIFFSYGSIDPKPIFTASHGPQAPSVGAFTIERGEATNLVLSCGS